MWADARAARGVRESRLRWLSVSLVDAATRGSSSPVKAGNLGTTSTSAQQQVAFELGVQSHGLDAGRC